MAIRGARTRDSGQVGGTWAWGAVAGLGVAFAVTLLFARPTTGTYQDAGAVLAIFSSSAIGIERLIETVVDGGGAPGSQLVAIHYDESADTGQGG